MPDGGTQTDIVKVLFAEDNRGDFVLAQQMLNDTPGATAYAIDWARSREEALAALGRRMHDVAIVDYNLVDGTALDILREAIAMDWPGPVIILTGQHDPAVDTLAMKIGAFDYLTKGTLDPQMLERRIRYAIDRKHRDTLVEQTNKEMLRYIAELQEAKREIEVQRQRIVSLAYHLATVENADAVHGNRSGPRLAFGVHSPCGDIIGTWQFDQKGMTLQANTVLCELLEVESDAELCQRPMCDLVCDDSYDRLWAASTGRGVKDDFTVEIQLIGQQTGRRSWAVISVARIAQEGEEATFYASVVDITDRRNTEHSMRYLARHDSLTGLCNRAAFDERLRHAIALAQRTKMRMGVLCIDLDGFKAINDTHGHKAGDTVLREVAKRICSATRESDVVARLGGDEFAVLATNVVALEDAHILGMRIVERMNQPFQFRDHDVSFGASVGIALCPEDSGDPDDLLEYADMALYKAKAAGKGRVCLHQR